MSMTIGPPHNAGLEQYREAVNRRQLEEARRAGWPRLELEDLAFHRHWIEHRPTGRLFREHRGDVLDVTVFMVFAAFYLMGDGSIRFLESPLVGTPQTVAEIEARKADRERWREERIKPRPRPRS
jgi:hypothetical protein